MASRPQDRRLSKVQLKQAHDFADAMGLDTSAFGVLDVTGGQGCLVTEFRHPQTGAFFTFDWNLIHGEKFIGTWWPSHDGRHPEKWVEGWVAVKTLFESWLKIVKQEIQTPDVWALAREQRAWLTSDDDAVRQNTPFTATEQELIARHLGTISDYAVKTYNLQETEATYVREQLNYLRDAASRVGRFDWKNLAASTFANIMVTVGLDPDKVQKLAALATQLLGPLVLGLGRLLP